MFARNRTGWLDFAQTKFPVRKSTKVLIRRQIECYSALFDTGALKYRLCSNTVIVSMSQRQRYALDDCWGIQERCGRTIKLFMIGGEALEYGSEYGPEHGSPDISVCSYRLRRILCVLNFSCQCNAGFLPETLKSFSVPRKT